MGAGSAAYSSTCGYEAYQDAVGGESGFGIMQVEKDGRPLGVPATPFDPLKWAKSNPATDEPTTGALLSGDLAGFGKRTVRDESAGRTYTVNVVYHADNVSAMVNRMIALGC